MPKLSLVPSLGPLERALIVYLIGRLKKTKAGKFIFIEPALLVALGIETPKVSKLRHVSMVKVDL